uniref:Uncharacterized protein n=1 Tax=Glossina brevipalpis TaxID=37001 RepID=A0A1A9WNK4_9MUSC
MLCAGNVTFFSEGSGFGDDKSTKSTEAAGEFTKTGALASGIILKKRKKQRVVLLGILQNSKCDGCKERWYKEAHYVSSYIVAHLPVTKKFKRIVLELHNYYRNDGIDAAKRLQHDNCRNTKRYVLAGQNLVNNVIRVGGTITPDAIGEMDKVDVFGIIADHLRLMYPENDMLSERKQFPDSSRRVEYHRTFGILYAIVPLLQVETVPVTHHYDIASMTNCL